MVALYQAGRQADALRAAEALRKALRDELGVDPSTAMQDLERRVLDQDPLLLATEAGFMTPLPAWTAEVLPFVGREAELDQVLSYLAQAVDEGIRFVLIEGEAGVGKSRFLSQIARRVVRDAIVLPLHAHDVFSPSLHSLARVLSEATMRVSDDELRVMLEDVPEVPNDIERVRAIASALIAGSTLNGLLLDENLLWGMPKTCRAVLTSSRPAPAAFQHRRRQGGHHEPQYIRPRAGHVVRAARTFLARPVVVHASAIRVAIGFTLARRRRARHGQHARHRHLETLRAVSRRSEG